MERTAYHARTLSNLLVTVVMEPVDGRTCEVTIVAGGGGSGILSLDLGSESNTVRQVVDAIEAYCADAGLTVERASGVD